MTTDPQRGLYAKFEPPVRTDGRSAPGEKHHGCDYFILDLTHDPYARAALSAYAGACEDEHPALADDLLRKLGWADAEHTDPRSI